MFSLNHKILLLSAITLLSLPHVLQAQNNPKAVVAEPVSDIGRFYKGNKILHDFVIRNEGKADLVISDVKASCSCTATDYDKTIAPGKAGKIKVTVDPGMFNGPIFKNITVYTNDPSNAEIVLSIKADIYSYLNANPGYARFLIVQGEEGGMNEVTSLITSSDGARFKVLSAECSIPGMNISWHEARDTERNEAAGKQWVVNMKIPYNAAAGAMAGHVKIQTDYPKQNILEIPVNGYVRPMFSVLPASPDFGNISLTEPLKKNITVHIFAAVPPKIIAAETNIKGLDADLKQDEPNEYHITLTLEPTMAKGAFDGKLFIHTDSKFKPLLELQLKGNVQ